MIKFIVKYEIAPIRFASVICPNCDEEFDAKWHGSPEDGGYIHDDYDLQNSKFNCPKCKQNFSTSGEKIEIKAI